ncbi:MAG: winged helix-turn-helix domain-containing protein [Planctomycetota bacterium]
MIAPRICITIPAARRLALARAGLDEDSDRGAPTSPRAAAHATIRRFGYLQLDTVSVAGARSHAIVLHSRTDGLDPGLAETLLQPGEPLFEYWGHEASWMPIELYPVFGFRREEFRRHPWWGEVLRAHKRHAKDLLKRVLDHGPVRSLDLEGQRATGWWNLGAARKVIAALWSAGDLAIRERRNFQRSYDLAERVIPVAARTRDVPRVEAIAQLFLLALDGHGFATTSTLAATWRLRRCRADIAAALALLVERGDIVACQLVDSTRREGATEKPQTGWIRPAHYERALELERERSATRARRPVLLSPFDPLLWDRARVERLFGFRQRIEIYTPAAKRTYGYYCLPVLAGERLIGRVDLKAHRKAGQLEVRAAHLERETKSDRSALHRALARYADAVQLKVSR